MEAHAKSIGTQGSLRTIIAHSDYDTCFSSGLQTFYEVIGSPENNCFQRPPWESSTS
jgi:hypothetical protein